MSTGKLRQTGQMGVRVTLDGEAGPPCKRWLSESGLKRRSKTHCSLEVNGKAQVNTSEHRDGQKPFSASVTQRSGRS